MPIGDTNVPITIDLRQPSGSTKSSATASLFCYSCKQIHEDARFVEIDGIRFGNYSAEYLNYTEAKWVYHHSANRRSYLEAIEKKRGSQAMSKLRNTMLEIHHKTK